MTSSPRLVPIAGLLCTTLVGCDRSSGSVSCGLDAFTKPLAVKQAFAEGATLTTLPEAVPNGLAVRLIAGPAWHASVAGDGRGGWRVTTTGAVAKNADIGYGVVVVDDNNVPLGVLAFPGRTIAGAPDLGRLAIADTLVPLLAVRISAAAIQDSTCPVFPDSLR